MTAFGNFTRNIRIVRDFIGLGQTIDALTLSVLEPPDEIYRSSLAMSVSALDLFVHEKVAEELLQISLGNRSGTEHYDTFPVGVGSVLGVTGSDLILSLSQEFRYRNSRKTFQSPDQISEALRPISSRALWRALGDVLNQRPEELRRELDLIVKRRNQIVHEFDVKPGEPVERWNIDAEMALRAVWVVEGIVAGIEAVLAAEAGGVAGMGELGEEIGGLEP